MDARVRPTHASPKWRVSPVQIALGLLVLLGGGIGTTGWTLRYGDASPPEDQDLVLDEATIREARNGWRVVRDALLPTERDDPGAIVVAREACDRVARLPGLSPPEGRVFFGVRTGQVITIELLERGAIAALDAGDPDLAVADGTRAFRLAEQLRAGTMAPPHGAAAYQLGLDALEVAESIIRHPGCPDSAVAALLAASSAHRFDGEDRARAIRGAYTELRAELIQSAEQRKPSWEFKPYQTLEGLARDAREWIANADAPIDERRPPRASFLTDRFGWNEKGFQRRIVIHERLLQVWNAASLLDTRERVVRTTLAIELFARRHGRLPETLETLVPEILDAVPRSPVSGRPLSYDRVARRVIVGNTSFPLRISERWTRTEAPR